MKPVVDLYKLGRLPYVKALKVQQLLFENLKHSVTAVNSDLQSIKTSSQINADEKSQQPPCRHLNKKVGNSLILVEHEPVYTIGIRSKQYNDKYVSQLKEKLDEHKLRADFVETNRGGLITFHGPGQLVAYPIIYLGDFKTTIRDRSVKAYVNLLEKTIIDTLTDVGVAGAHTVREYPGVWLDSGERKIAFIGIACKRYVTMHGVSINCNCDLSWFDHIVSCGIEDKSITSVNQELLVGKQTQNFPNMTNIDKQTSNRGGSNFFTTPPYSGSGATCLHGSRSDVESISKAFCISFSRHFDCNIREDLGLDEAQPSIIDKINSLTI